MKRSSRFINIGITAALIAAGLWFLYWGYGPLSDNNSWWSMHQGWNGHGAMMGFGSGMGVFGLLFWGLILFVAVISLKARAHRPIESAPTKPYEPLEILKQRYARGEINKEKFKALRHDLGA
jgi:putative membrane protein